ncbi:MAG TPA: SpoIIE family protein phosphatase [Bryobacteraceae bacterium]|nr:SpoIIE family protein phosphatase [Bryobacteraceae bacterium]
MAVKKPEARLEFNDDQGRRIIRIEKDVFTIGRRGGQDLHLTGNEVSREHAELVYVDGHYVLRDRDSRFGTYVNGERVKEHVMAHLDRVRFGTADPEMMFFLASSSVERSTDLAVGDLRQISSLLEGLRAVGSSRVLDDVLALVLDSSIDVSAAERGFIMLANAEGDLEFKLGRARGRASLDGTVFRTSRKIPNQVFLSGRAQIVMDMLDSDWAEAHGATIAMGIRNVLCVPLSLVHFRERRKDVSAIGNEERRIGVLYLDSKDKASLHSRVTIAALETLAREAAVAIENTRLYREALEKVQIEQELRIAADMQQALLPPRRRLGANYESVGAMVSCLAIGGDFFDCFDLPDGGAGFVLCDVSGKGPSAALMTAMIQGMFRALSESSNSPAETLRRVNQVLSQRSVKSKYATSFYGMLWPDGRFVSSNGGHNPPIVARQDGTVHRLEKGGLPLGLFGKAAYQEETTVLHPGDTLLLFSDGVSEAANPEGEEFGDHRLVEALRESRREDPQKLLDLLFSKAKAFAGTQPQADDMTALIVRCTAMAAAATT